MFVFGKKNKDNLKHAIKLVRENELLYKVFECIWNVYRRKYKLYVLHDEKLLTECFPQVWKYYRNIVNLSNSKYD